MLIGSSIGAAILFGGLWALTKVMGWPTRTLWVFLTGCAVTAAGFGVLSFAIDAVNLIWDGAKGAVQGAAGLAEGIG